MATPLRPGLSLATTAQPLEKAFSYKKAPAVALIVNSPGGSPVQSRLIFQRIRDLAAENKKDVLVFVEDVAASGGYMISLAGDEIIADPTSIVGSIGVVAAGFGFPELLKKMGVERRVYTAGDKKVILDPFREENADDIDYLKSLQQDIHEVFIDMVKARRGDVLSDDKDIQVWVTADGAVYVNEEPVTVAELRRTFLAAARSNPNTMVVIKADGGVSHSRVVAVMDQAQAQGLTRLAIATDAGEDEE